MKAHKIATTLTEDGKLVLQGLPFYAGDMVEVILLHQTQAQNPSPPTPNQYPLQGTVYRYDEPFAPAVPPEDWEALK